MQGFLFNCNNMSRLLLIQYCDESRCAGSRAEGFQGARAEARPLIAVFGMSAATKQNGKLIDSCKGGLEKIGWGCMCMHVCLHECDVSCVSVKHGDT